MTMLSLESVDAYYGKSHVLQDVGMTVEEGSLTVLLGRNGAGKSTLIKSVNGFVEVRSGRITYRGEDITGLAPEVIARKGIGYVPEERRIFPNLSVVENLRLGTLGVDGAHPVEEVLEEFSILSDKTDRLGRDLSGGEQQMLSIARAVVQDPDLLLVDEPSEGLMPKLRTEMLDLLAELRDRGQTILLTEQYAEEALEIADRVYILVQGEVVEEGPAGRFRDDISIVEQYVSI